MSKRNITKFRRGGGPHERVRGVAEGFNATAVDDGVSMTMASGKDNRGDKAQ
jgi:hypothetical protein